MIRWVLGIEETSPGVFEYTNLYDRQDIPDDQMKEANDKISEKRNILLEDVADIISKKLLNKEDSSFSVQCYRWYSEERVWKPVSCLSWVLQIKE
jgi:hypothetical protein